MILCLAEAIESSFIYDNTHNGTYSINLSTSLYWNLLGATEWEISDVVVL